MKVLALNGSHHARGVTYHAIQLVAQELQKEGIDTDILQIGATPLAGCIDCRKCRTNGHRCIHNDIVNTLIERLPDYDGLILGWKLYRKFGKKGSIRIFGRRF